MVCIEVCKVYNLFFIINITLIDLFSSFLMNVLSLEISKKKCFKSTQVMHKLLLTMIYFILTIYHLKLLVQYKCI